MPLRRLGCAHHAIASADLGNVNAGVLPGKALVSIQEGIMEYRHWREKVQVVPKSGPGFNFVEVRSVKLVLLNIDIVTGILLV